MSAVTRPVARSNRSVFASQPGKRVFCHSISTGRTTCEWVSAVFGVTASMASLQRQTCERVDAMLADRAAARGAFFCSGLVGPFLGLDERVFGIGDELLGVFLRQPHDFVDVAAEAIELELEA